MTFSGQLMPQFYVYIMSNMNRVLYVGMTNDLERRVLEHKSKLVPGFTSKYGLTRLVYYEVAEEPMSAIAREKEIKGWVRGKKLAMITEGNPGWRDLSADFLDARVVEDLVKPSTESS